MRSKPQKQPAFDAPAPTGTVLFQTKGFPDTVPVGTLICSYSLQKLQQDNPTEWSNLCTSRNLTDASLSGEAWERKDARQLVEAIVELAFGRTGLRQFSRIEKHSGLHHGVSLLTLRVRQGSTAKRN